MSLRYHDLDLAGWCEVALQIPHLTHHYLNSAFMLQDISGTAAADTSLRVWGLAGP